MKIGIRKPSLKKSIKARTTGKLKRSVKKTLIPGYGKKGMGWIKDPKKAAYNKIYNKTTVSLFSLGGSGKKSNKKSTANKSDQNKGYIQTAQPVYQAYADIEGKEAMKICKFCGTENSDSAASCSSCGGNEFKNKCGNCGNVFDEGNFCPNCGVKAGTRARYCPKCGKEYYSAACPDCGYTPNRDNNTGSSNHTTIVYTTPTPQQVRPVKKRKTWLWVLGWICIFPVPLTILITRNREMDKKVKIGIIAAAWIFYLFLALLGNSDSNSSSAAPEKQASQAVVSEVPADTDASDPAASEKTAPEDTAEAAVSSTQEAEEEAPAMLFEDEVINRFLTECEFDYGEIEQGNIKAKCYVRINDCRTELLNADTDVLVIKINGYHTDSIDDKEVLEAFKLVAHTINGTDYDAELEDVTGKLLEHDTEIYNGTIGDISYDFKPFVELSKGISECRIQIETAKYNTK